MKTMYTLSLVISFLMLTACLTRKEAITPQYEDYIGYWESRVFVIEIYPNGGASFDSNRRRDPQHIDGWVVFREEDGQILFVGDSARCKLDLVTPPTTALDPATGMEYVYMVLDTVELHKRL